MRTVITSSTACLGFGRPQELGALSSLSRSIPLLVLAQVSQDNAHAAHHPSAEPPPRAVIQFSSREMETNVPDPFIPGRSRLLAVAIRCYPHGQDDSLWLWAGRGLGTSSSGDMNFQGPDPQVGLSLGSRSPSARKGEELGVEGRVL